jgi:hypothetical protein
MDEDYIKYILLEEPKKYRDKSDALTTEFTEFIKDSEDPDWYIKEENRKKELEDRKHKEIRDREKAYNSNQSNQSNRSNMFNRTGRNGPASFDLLGISSWFSGGSNNTRKTRFFKPKRFKNKTMINKKRIKTNKK